MERNDRQYLPVDRGGEVKRLAAAISSGINYSIPRKITRSLMCLIECRQRTVEPLSIVTVVRITSDRDVVVVFFIT